MTELLDIETEPSKSLIESKRILNDRDALETKVYKSQLRVNRYIILGILSQFFAVEIGKQIALVLTFLTPQGAALLVFLLVPLLMLALIAKNTHDRDVYTDALTKINVKMDEVVSDTTLQVASQKN